MNERVLQVIMPVGRSQRLDGLDQSMEILPRLVIALVLFAIEDLHDLSPLIRRTLNVRQIDRVLVHEIDREMTGQRVPRLLGETQSFRRGEFMLHNDLGGQQCTHRLGSSSNVLVTFNAMVCAASRQSSFSEVIT